MSEQKQPTWEEIISCPELSLRGMADEDFDKIGNLGQYLADVVAHAKRNKEAADAEAAKRIHDHGRNR